MHPAASTLKILNTTAHNWSIPMATKPMPFEKSSKDVDSKAVTKKYGKEGSKKEEAYDRKQAAATTKMKTGGMVGKRK